MDLLNNENLATSHYQEVFSFHYKIISSVITSIREQYTDYRPIVEFLRLLCSTNSIVAMLLERGAL